MARRKTKRFRKKFKKFNKFGGKLKQKVRRYVKRYKRRIFKRRVMKQSELKWYYSVGTHAPKSVSSIQPITDYCLKLNDYMYLPQGTSKNTRIGFKYFVNSITFRFSYGNPNSANGISGNMSLVHIKERTKDGLLYNTATALAAPVIFAQANPYSITKEYSKLGLFSTKAYTKNIQLANSATVGVGFDQGQTRAISWQIKIPINKEINLSEESIKGIEFPNQFLWVMYYTSPWAHTVGTIPDVQFNYYMTFYDL